MKPEIEKTIKEQAKDQSLSKLSKQIRRETKNKVNLEKKSKKQKGLDKVETDEYINTINEKILLLLQGITAQKVKDSNLASVSKAFRSLLGQLPSVPEKGQEPSRNISVNFNIDTMTPEQIADMLTKKSSGEE